VIGVEFARRARDWLAEGGLAVEYHEFPGAHQIDVDHLPAAAGWLSAALHHDTTSSRGTQRGSDGPGR
jgi:predicted esterase